MDDVDNNTFTLRGDVRIDVGQPTENFITASAVAVIESSLLVFVGYNDISGVSYLSGVSYGTILAIPVNAITLYSSVCHKEHHH